MLAAMEGGRTDYTRGHDETRPAWHNARGRPRQWRAEVQTERGGQEQEPGRQTKVWRNRRASREDKPLNNPAAETQGKRPKAKDLSYTAAEG